MEALGLPLNLPAFLSWVWVLQFYFLLTPLGRSVPFGSWFSGSRKEINIMAKMRILHYVSYDQNSYQIFRVSKVLGRNMLTRFGSYSVFANTPTESTFSCNFWWNLGQWRYFCQQLFLGTCILYVVCFMLLLSIHFPELW